MTNKQKLISEKRRNASLIKMLEAEREKTAGYEQIAKIHTAYISILLKRLEATEDKMVTITRDEVTEATSRYETRAMFDSEKGEYSLWCAEVDNEQTE